jgi:magnesium and cobalt transporter
MALNVLDLGEREAADVMIPRHQVCVIPADLSALEALKHINGSHHTLYPAVGTNPDEIVGVVDVRDLARAIGERGLEAVQVSELLRPAHVIPETKKLLELLAEFKAGGSEMVVVADEYGRMAGVVTVMDMLEEIVGDLEPADEHDVEIEELVDGRLRVHGRLPIETFNERFDFAIPVDDFRTLGGLVFGSLGRLPRVGDRVLLDGIVFQVLELDGPRAARLEITLPAPGELAA